MSLPDTRHSLLARLYDRGDKAAWVEFCTIYEPAIYRLGRRFGLQDADAREVSQEVLLLVSRKIEAFDPTAAGRFRGWLSTIARNITIDLLRRRRECGTGRSDLWRRLSELPLEDRSAEDAFEQEARYQKFRWAAEQVRDSVSSTTWQAFWLTSVEGLPGPEVARRLGINVGAVYVARCRTLARIKSLVETFSEDPS